MKCQQCGQEFEGNFCPKCGMKAPEAAEQTAPAQEQPAPQTEVNTPQPVAAEQPSVNAVNESPANDSAVPVSPVQETESKPKAFCKLPKKCLIGLVGAAVVLIGVIIAIILICGGSKMFNPPEHFFGFMPNEDGKTEILMDAKLLDFTIDGEVDTAYSSLDGAGYCALTKEGDLYYVDKSQAKKIASDIKSFRFGISGNGGAYLTKDNDLYTFTVKGATAKIAGELNNPYYVTSPNGKCVLYTANNDDGELVLYCYNGSESEQYGKNVRPIAIADGAKYAYAVTTDDSALNVYDSKGERSKLADDTARYIFNQDFSQVIFTANGKLFYSAKGEQKITICKETECYPVQTYYNNAYHGAGCVIAPFDNLLGHVYAIGDNLAILEKDGDEIEYSKIVTGVSDYDISEDGSTIVYKKNSKLYTVKAKAQAEPTLLAEEVTSFDTDADCKHIYYLNEDDELMYIKGTSKPQKITADIKDWAMCKTTGYVFYKDSDGALNYTKNGSKYSKIADDVFDIAVSDSTAYYIYKTEADDESGKDEYTLYASNGNHKFTLIMKDMPMD